MASNSRTRGIEIAYGQASDPGLDPAKQVNEDACGYAETPLGHLFVLCDGMGGHAGGKQASDIAIRTVFDVVGNAGARRTPKKILRQAIAEAAKRVYEFGGPSSNHQRPGSTCVAILLHDGEVDVAHVGDSRAYALRGTQIYRLTRDHSMVQELLDNGVITEEEAIGHPDNNKITRALGMTPVVEVEVSEEPTEAFDGDIFILASDGLTDLALNQDIINTTNDALSRGDVQLACDELVALANRRGGHDNITVQVVKIIRTGDRKTLPLQDRGSDPRSAASPTIEGAPAPLKTVIQEPTLPVAQAPSDPLDFPASRPSGGRLEHDRGPRRRSSIANNPLIWVVLIMAGVIGMLAAGLLWSLFLR